MKRSVKPAGKLTALESAEKINSEIQEIDDRIRKRAFEISTSRGHAGREMDDWLSAEAEIISVPPVEIIERDDTYFVKIGMAGVDSNDVEVIAGGNQVLVKAEFRHDHREREATIHLCDFKSAVVFRKIDFPERIDQKTMEMEFRDGMLRITVCRENPASAGKSQKTPGERPVAKSATSSRSKAKARTKG